MPAWLEKFLPILLLLIAVGFVVRRLPKVELGHPPEFKRRRVLNWVPLGLTYAFLYFGRYNLSAIAGELDKAGILSRSAFNEIDGYGAWVYGFGFLINGPLTDRFGEIEYLTTDGFVEPAWTLLEWHHFVCASIDRGRPHGVQSPDPTRPRPPCPPARPAGPAPQRCP